MVFVVVFAAVVVVVVGVEIVVSMIGSGAKLVPLTPYIWHLTTIECLGLSHILASTKSCAFSFVHVTYRKRRCWSNPATVSVIQVSMTAKGQGWRSSYSRATHNSRSFLDE